MKSFIKDVILFFRLKHWFKNTFIFAPLLFSWKFFDYREIQKSILAFFAFSFISSAIYIINDIHDRDADKHHPKKSKRPIAAGKIKIPFAVFISLLLIVFCFLLSLVIDNYFIVCAFSYFVLNLFYTFIGKKMVIIDAFCIAFGFVLRVIAGSFAITVVPSGWIMMTTFFLCLFLGFGKRRYELMSLKNNGGEHRPVLMYYTEKLLDFYILSCAAITIISYALYTLSQSVQKHFHVGDKLVFTVPFFTFCVFRYIYFLWIKDDGEPTDVIFKDPWIIIGGFSWLLSTIGIIAYSLNTR